MEIISYNISYHKYFWYEDYNFLIAIMMPHYRQNKTAVNEITSEGFSVD